MKLRGFSECPDELAVGVTKGPARLLGRCVQQWGGSPRTPVRSVVGILACGALGPQDFVIALHQTPCGVVFDGTNERGDAGSVRLWSQMAPARQGGELEALPGDACAPIIGPPPARELVFETAIDPGPGDRLPGEQSVNRRRAGPLCGSSDQALLAAVTKDVEQAFDLSGLLLGDGDRLIATPPEALSPAHCTADLAGEVGVQVVHEGREALGIRGREQEVVVVPEECEGVNLDREEPHGAGENSATELSDVMGRLEQEPALERPARDLDEAVGRQKAQSAAHTSYRR